MTEGGFPATTNEALQFLDYCAAEPDIHKVIAGFLSAISSFGFEVAAGGAWVGTGRARAHRFYFNTWPEDWFALYEARGFFNSDPMVIETRRRMTPIYWSDMAAARSFTVEGAHVLEAATAYGWKEVVGFPFHGPAGYQGLVTAATRQDVSLSHRDRALLRTMALSVHDRAHASVGLGGTQPKTQLSLREGECMGWVAAGKTDAEIGVILGLSPATVHYHVESSKKKLGVHSRTEAIALLVLAGAV